MIVGDANRMDVPQTLKLGATSMLLWLAEHADETGYDLAALLDSMALVDPVSAMHTVSHDLTLQAELPLRDGGRHQRVDHAGEAAGRRVRDGGAGVRHRHARRAAVAGQAHHRHHGAVGGQALPTWPPSGMPTTIRD